MPQALVIIETAIILPLGTMYVCMYVCLSTRMPQALVIIETDIILPLGTMYVCVYVDTNAPSTCDHRDGHNLAFRYYVFIYVCMYVCVYLDRRL